MRIVDKKKFFKMIVVVMSVVIGMLFYFTNISFSKGEVKEKTIYVSNGDTLWTIASEEQESNTYYENKDIRDIVYEIKKINNINNNTALEVGQKIIVRCL